MTGVVVVFDLVLGVLRIAFFALAVVLTVVFAIDWAVRTRRISPFAGIARFMRSTVDPLIVPVERRVIRAGGAPSTAPWWALVFVVVSGIVIITLLGFLRGLVLDAAFAARTGPSGLLRILVVWTFALLQLAILVRVIVSWTRISPYSPWVRWSFSLTEPFLRPLRAIVPTIGMVDITPIIAYFVLRLLQGVVLSLLPVG